MKRLTFFALTVLLLSFSPTSVDAQLNCPTKVDPVMPKLAIDNNIEGRVWAQAMIKDGVVTGVTILSGPPIFHAAVRDAMMQYKCIPQGDDVATQEFNFKIEPANKSLPATGAPARKDPFLEAVATHTRGDFPRALKQFKALAANGDANAQVMLGNMYGTGEGVKQSDAESLKWYRMAAAKGDVSGQYKLGRIYSEGLGVAVNVAEAMKWFQLSANNGYADSQTAVGEMYLMGKGVPQNYSEAATWYRMAANQGNPNGQYALAGLYRTGRGVVQDENEALKWYQMAAARGDAKSKAAMDSMQVDITARQRVIDQQQRSAREQDERRRQAEESRRQAGQLQQQQQQEERERAAIERQKCLKKTANPWCLMSCMGVPPPNVPRCQNDCKDQERAAVAACNGIYVPPAQQIIIRQE